MILAADRLDRWLRLPKTSAAYGLEYRGDYPGIVARHRTFLADAVALADPSVDFRTYSTVLIVAGGGGDPSTRGRPADRRYRRRRRRQRAAGHGRHVGSPGNSPRISSTRAGHLFGLPDNYDFSLPFAEGTRNLGRWDPMSNTGSLSHFLGWVKWKLGWLDASQLRCSTSAGVLEETLSPIEMRGGREDDRAADERDDRRGRRGAHPAWCSNQVCDSGVIVYTVDVQARSGTVGARIKPARDDAGGAQCGSIPRAAFDIGPGEIPRPTRTAS